MKILREITWMGVPNRHFNSPLSYLEFELELEFVVTLPLDTSIGGPIMMFRGGGC